MIIIPAIDIKDGQCVRLKQGMIDTSIVYNKDPIAQAKLFESIGCKKIHIVDLDAAILNSKKNQNIISSIKKSVSLEIQLGGGIRNFEQINYWMNCGIDNLIIGSMVVENPELINQVIKKFPNKIYIGIDDKDNKIMISGWKKESKKSYFDLIDSFENKMIKGFIYTDINRDGMLKGLNFSKIQKFVENTKHKVIVSGGVSSIEDIKGVKLLNKKNITGIITGKAIYSGLLKLQDAMEACINA